MIEIMRWEWALYFFWCEWTGNLIVLVPCGFGSGCRLGLVSFPRSTKKRSGNEERLPDSHLCLVRPSTVERTRSQPFLKEKRPPPWCEVVVLMLSKRSVFSFWTIICCFVRSLLGLTESGEEHFHRVLTSCTLFLRKAERRENNDFWLDWTRRRSP